MTTAPSVNLTSVRTPEIRARTSTVSTELKRPVYSSHSTTFFSTGFATDTDGGGGPPGACACCFSPQEARTKAAKPMRLAFKNGDSGLTWHSLP